MDKETQEALQKAAEYVADAQPKLDAFEANKVAFAKRAEQTAAILVNRGILDESKQADFLSKCAEDACFALKFLEKLATCVGADNIGGPSGIKAAAGEDKRGPFEKAFFPSESSNGMIE